MRFEDFWLTVRAFQKGIDNKELSAFEDASECEVVFRDSNGNHDVTAGIHLEINENGVKAVIQ